jgi:hypothetical protein
MTKDEALRLALEALENGKRVRDAEGGTKYQPDLENQAITAIKAALEAKDEPVGTAGELFSNTALERLDLRPSTNIYITPLPVAEPYKRTWVGLTDIDYAGLPLEQVGLVRWAEAKLKEKNI